MDGRTTASIADEIFRVSRGNVHRMMLLMILFSTVCRPDAARDLTPFQHDTEHGLLALNPAGRRQAKKYCPTIPVADALEPWSRSTHASALHWHARRQGGQHQDDVARDPQGCWARWQGAAVFGAAHDLARAAQGARPEDQIESMLGHRGSVHGTTGIYAPYDPLYCQEAV